MTTGSGSNARWNAIAQAVVALGQLTVTLGLVRLLEPREFGSVALVYLVAGVVAVLDEGSLSTGLVAADERDRHRVGVVFWQEILVGACVAAAVALLAAPLALAFGQPAVVAFAYALAPMFVVTAPRRLAQAVLSRAYEFRGMSLSRIVATVGFGGVTLVLAKAGYGAWALVIGLIARMTIESAGFFWAARHEIPLRPPPRGYLRSGYGRAGLAKVGERLAAYGVDRVDLLIIGYALGPTGLGVYDVFKRTSIGLYQQVVPAVSRVALPQLARLRTEPAALARAYLRQLRYVCLVLCPAYVFQVVFAEELVAVVFGGEWGGYDRIFAWVSGLLLVRSCSGPVDALLMARGWVRRELVFQAVALALLVAVLLRSVGQGLEAAVVAVTWLNVALALPIYWWLVRPAADVGARRYGLAIAGPLVLALLSVGGAWALATVVAEGAAARLICGAIATGVVFATGALVAYPSQRSRMWGWVRRLLRTQRS